MRSNPFGLLAASSLAIFGAALVIIPFFIVPHRPPAAVSRNAAVDPDAATAVDAPPQIPMTPETLVRSFVRPGQRTSGGAEPLAVDRGAGPALKQDSEPKVADWLGPLGKITDEAGIVRLYFKSSRDGQLIRVRQDGAEENGIALLEDKDDQYLISINGERYVAMRRRK